MNEPHNFIEYNNFTSTKRLFSVHLTGETEIRQIYLHVGGCLSEAAAKYDGE